MFGSLKKRGGTIVVAAIVGAVAAGSPAVAAEVVAFAKSAGNANTVNKIGASKTPRAGMLVPLNAKGQFPAAVIPASRQAAGQAGPAGPAGPQGLQGASGPPAATGQPAHKGRRVTRALRGSTGRMERTVRPEWPERRATQGPMAPTEPTEPRATRASRGSTGTNGTNGTNGASRSSGRQGRQGRQGRSRVTRAIRETKARGRPGLSGARRRQPGPARQRVAHLGRRPRQRQAWNNAFRSSYPPGDQTSFLEWNVPLAAGTWAMEVTLRQADLNAGILTFSLDGETAIGTLDAYSAAAIERNVQGVTSRASRWRRPACTRSACERTTNNPSRRSFYGYLVWLRLVKQ